MGSKGQTWWRSPLNHSDRNTKIFSPKKSATSPLSALTRSTTVPSSGADTEEADGAEPPSPKRTSTTAAFVRSNERREVAASPPRQAKSSSMSRYNTRSSKRLRGRSPTPPPCSATNTSNSTQRSHTSVRYKNCFKRVKPPGEPYVGNLTSGMMDLATSYGVEINPRTHRIVSWWFPSEDQVRHNLRFARIQTWADRVGLRAASENVPKATASETTDNSGSADVYMMPNRKYEDWRYMWVND